MAHLLSFGQLCLMSLRLQQLLASFFTKCDTQKRIDVSKIFKDLLGEKGVYTVYYYLDLG